MKMGLVITALLGCTFGAAAESNTVNTSASPRFMVFTPSSGGTQLVLRTFGPKNGVKRLGRTQILGPEKSGSANRLPWAEPRRDLHLIDMRTPPAAAPVNE